MLPRMLHWHIYIAVRTAVLLLLPFSTDERAAVVPSSFIEADRLGKSLGQKLDSGHVLFD